MRRNPPKDFSFLTERPFAHRGLHAPGGPVENSLAAFDRAIAGGYGIELDVRITADKDAVVFHDAELPRLVNAAGRIADLTTAELAAFRPVGSDAPIPTLREAIEHIRGRAPTLIEVKAPEGHDYVNLCRAIRRSIEGATNWAAVMSFDPRVVRWFRDHHPPAVRGLVVTEDGDESTRGLRGRIKRYFAIRHADPHFLAYDIRSLPSPSVTRFRPRPVLTWTVRSDDDRIRAAECADQIIFEQAVKATA